MKSKKLLLKGSYRRKMLSWKSRLFSNTKQKLQDKNSRDQNRGTDRHTHIPPPAGRKAYRCFLPLCWRGCSSWGYLKMSWKMGSYFLKITAETVKFLSSLSVRSLKSWGRFAISSHFFILLKNSIKLILKIKKIFSKLIQVYKCKKKR